MESEPESVILQMLRAMRADMSEMRDQMVTKADFTSEIASVHSEIATVRSEVLSLRADVASDFMSTRKDMGERIAGLRRAVIDYHTTTSVMAC